MPNHVRQQIKEQVATTVTGLTTTGSNVYQNRLYEIDPDSLPALNVYTKAERSEVDSMGPDGGLERLLTLVVEGYARATSDLDDTLDTISKEVETALAADRQINDLADDSYLASTEMTYTGQGDSPAGVVMMTYEINYRTRIDTPDAAY